MKVPPRETEAFREFLRSNPQLFDTTRVAEHFRATGNTVFPDPFGSEISYLVVKALKEQRPLSVIRIGDGEANLLTHGNYPETPYIDASVVTRTVSLQQDRFRVVEPWHVVLRTMLHGAVASADIVGVPGLWRPSEVTLESSMEQFMRDPRGVYGYWRGVDYMMRMAESSLVVGKTIASAHLYFGILKNLAAVIGAARRVVCVTSRDAAIETLRTNFPEFKIEGMRTGCGDGTDDGSPHFLSKFSAALGRRLTASLFLVGAGPWAEIYCTWIKERGGVALDLGSGFDVLAGQSSRPIHRCVDIESLVANMIAPPRRRAD